MTDATPEQIVAFLTRGQAMTRESDIVEQLRNAHGPFPDHWSLYKEAADEIARLRTALQPFARNADAVSLSEALGHIEREHLRNARAALGAAAETEFRREDVSP